MQEAETPNGQQPDRLLASQRLPCFAAESDFLPCEVIYLNPPGPSEIRARHLLRMAGSCTQPHGFQMGALKPELLITLWQQKSKRRDAPANTWAGKGSSGVM